MEYSGAPMLRAAGIGCNVLFLFAHLLSVFSPKFFLYKMYDNVDSSFLFSKFSPNRIILFHKMHM